MRKITILLITLILLFIIIINYNVKEPCLFNINSDIKLMSRVPIENQQEINREYYYNDTWMKICRKNTIQDILNIS